MTRAAPLALLLALLLTAPASARWSTTGSGSGKAETDDLIAAVIDAPSSSPAATVITWTAQAALGASPSAGTVTYRVQRATGAGAYANVASGPCSGDLPKPTTSCTDTVTTDGTYRYRVTATLATWTAVSNEKTVAVDATGPTNVTLADPGTPLRGNITWNATATDSGSGVARVTFQAAPAGTSSWSDACSVTAQPYTCTTDSNTAPDGLYDLRVIAVDGVGNATTSPVVANRRIDNTAPSTTLTDPGSPLRRTVSLTSTATDGGSGVASVKVQRSPAGAATWTDICSTATATPCSFVTTGVADGSYDLRTLVTDVAGNTATSVVTARRIDNTKPTGTDVQTANKTGGTAGRPEAGDTVTFSFSEAMAPASFLAGWTGASTNVTVAVSAANPGVLTVNGVALGSVGLAKQYALLGLTFNTSPMVMTGSTIKITLGTAAVGGLATTATGTGTLGWMTVATPTDLAGNSLTVGTVTETGTADLDF